MKVAVCDDQPQTLEDLKEQLLQISFVKKVHIYSDMTTFWAAQESGEHYDIVFMDIDWKQSAQTGIDFAEQLSETTPYMKIIYITAYTLDYVEDIFLKQANLCGFLKKPAGKDQLLRILKRIQKAQELTQGKLLIYFRGSHIAIPFRDILYLESRLHKTCIVLKKGEYLCGEKLELLKEKLDSRFLNCHKSYIVNMDYIQEFHGREIVLEGGHAIPVSKAKGKSAKEHFFAHVSGQM